MNLLELLGNGMENDGHDEVESEIIRGFWDLLTWLYLYLSTSCGSSL